MQQKYQIQTTVDLKVLHNINSYNKSSSWQVQSRLRHFRIKTLGESRKMKIGKVN